MSKNYMVGTRTIGFFIDKPRGVEKQTIVKELVEFVNISESDAKRSISRAVKFGNIKEVGNKLKLNKD